MFQRCFQLGILACLLAGCATQPTSPTPILQPIAAAPALAPPGQRLRIGVEFLPPEPDQTGAAPIADVLPQEAKGAPRRAPAADDRQRQDHHPDRKAQHTWGMSASDLAAIDEPIARETVRFVDDLMRADGRAVQREVRRPFLDWQPLDRDAGPQLWSEQENTEAQEEWVHEHGPSLLQKPLRQLLRRLPLVREFESGVHDFRSDHVPLSEPYRAVHGDQRRLGRLSLRIHAGELQDPLEVVYIRSGVRLGSSQETGKLSIDWQLSERVTLELRARTEYDTGARHLRADLAYWPSATSSVHLSVGDDLDFLSTSSIYSLFDSPMDGSPGILLYAIHTF